MWEGCTFERWMVGDVSGGVIALTCVGLGAGGRGGRAADLYLKAVDALHVELSMNHASDEVRGGVCCRGVLEECGWMYLKEVDV